MRRLTVILFGLAGAAQINRLIIILDWKFGTGQVTNSLAKSMTLRKKETGKNCVSDQTWLVLERGRYPYNLLLAKLSLEEVV